MTDPFTSLLHQSRSGITKEGPARGDLAVIILASPRRAPSLTLAGPTALAVGGVAQAQPPPCRCSGTAGQSLLPEEEFAGLGKSQTHSRTPLLVWCEGCPGLTLDPRVSRRRNTEPGLSPHSQNQDKCSM